MQNFRRRYIMTATVQVRQRGALTLPAKVRERYNIQPGDTFSLVDFDGILVLAPMAPLVPELAREIERARLEAGLSVEEMLKDLRRQRERYVTEKYGS
jgi:AbrB family looped-hinge helix DNA binding protein